MATVAEFSVSNSGFALGGICRAMPTATVDLERIVPTGDTLCPYLWVRGVSVAEATPVLSDAIDAADLTLVDDLGSRGLLYRVDWRGSDGLLESIVDAPVTLLTAHCTVDGWTVRVRADDHRDLARFRRICRDGGIDVELVRVQPLIYAGERDSSRLTAPQLEALELAHARGYFDDPRRVTLDEVASDLGISRQSLAGRLRRGHRNLLGQLFDDRDDRSLMQKF